MIAALHEFAALLEPSVQREEAPLAWEADESVASASCEVQHVATAQHVASASCDKQLGATPAAESPKHWVYRFQSAKLPLGTHALARISVLLRGPEKTGMRKYVQCVQLGLSVKNDEGGTRAQLVDMAENPDAADDERVLEFPRFPSERPLFFGTSVELLEVHVHFTELPPATMGRDMIKVVADAVFAPRAQGQTICMQLDRPDGSPETLPALAESYLVRDGETSELRMEFPRHYFLASKPQEQARLSPVVPEPTWGALTVALTAPMGSHAASSSAARAWGPLREERPYWVQQLEELSDILPTKYSMQ